ncbi:MAG: D-alanyl-D-alanine carboxypeptidase, partial [Proteobacteria bacterium]|nr:D-alanyl-D-alanine carboxypeptidase [Pseudomonadota bacterium]
MRQRSRGPAFALGLLLAALPFVVAPAPPAAAATVSALAIDADTGEILYADNPDQAYFPASLTKMMTLYLAFEALDQGRLTLGQRLSVSRHAAAQPPSRLGLAPGETITVEHAILALVTKSANDIAVVLAEAMGGGEPEFARLMTRTARRIGMGRTNFRNASGLHDRLQYTTARDMAKLARALIQDYPEFYPYFSTPSFTYRGVTHRNHNALLGEYGGVDGIKTGYVRASGYNLTASALRDGARVIGVVLGGNTPSERDRAMVAVLDAGFRRVATLQRREDILAFPGRDPAQALAMTGPGIA